MTVEKFVKTECDSIKGAIRELSKNSKGETLVDSDKQMYSFDEFCKSKLANDRLPSTVDAFAFHKDCICFTEYKSGFTEKISVQNFDKERVRCPKTNELCQDNWEYFVKFRKAQKSELIDALKLKAAESRKVFEYLIKDCCNCKSMHYHLVVVIDASAEDVMINSITPDGIPMPDNCNTIEDVKRALRRFKFPDIYYDSIDVFSVSEYAKKILET